MNSLRALVEELPRELDFGTMIGLEGDLVLITFRSHRAQKIRLGVRDDHYVFTSRILGQRRVAAFAWNELAGIVWPRNRRTPLVCFMLDQRDRLIGRIDHPRASLDPPELRAILLHLARECDRLEYLLTGRDEH